MKSIFKDSNRRQLITRDDLPFKVTIDGLHLVKISARCKSEKQLSGTDDEDLTIEIDGRKFPQLQNDKRYIDSPAAFSGGDLHNLKETVFFLIQLEKGEHTLSLIPDSEDSGPKTATVEEVEVFEVEVSEILNFTLNIKAEDSNNSPWVVFVLVDMALSKISAEILFQHRFQDSDDVKMKIDGQIIRNNAESKKWFWWRWWAALVDGTKIDLQTFTPNLEKGLHYIEFWSDRMPLLKSVSMSLNLPTIEPMKESSKLQPYNKGAAGEDYNRFDDSIQAATNFWNSFFSKQQYPPTELLNPNLVKAMIFRESKMGYDARNNGDVDVMQVWDEQNPAQAAILGATANEFKSPSEIGHMDYSYPESRKPVKVTTPDESIFWGVRWLYHIAQHLDLDDRNQPKIPYVRLWYSWRKTAEKYNGSDHKQKYVDDVFSILNTGVSLKDGTLWN